MQIHSYYTQLNVDMGSTSVLQVFYKCSTRLLQVYMLSISRCVLQVFFMCYLQLVYKCSTFVLQVFYMCSTCCLHDVHQSVCSTFVLHVLSTQLIYKLFYTCSTSVLHFRRVPDMFKNWIDTWSVVSLYHVSPWSPVYIWFRKGQSVITLSFMLYELLIKK